MSLLKGKTAIVFASSGAIAGAVAKSFARNGAFVYVTAKELASANAVAAEIENAGGKAKALQVDALDQAQIEASFQRLVAEQGKVDIVFNGIGIRPSLSEYGTPALALSYENFLKPLTTIVGSQFLTSRTAAKYMIQTKTQGTILTLTSSLSRSKIPFMAGITAASTGVEGLTRSLAAEFGMSGIKVICINPTGLGETRTIQETSIANAKTIGIPIEAFAAQLAQGYLLRKTPSLKEVGDVASFLVSDAGAALNSHIIDVDFGTSSVI